MFLLSNLNDLFLHHPFPTSNTPAISFLTNSIDAIPKTALPVAETMFRDKQ